MPRRWTRRWSGCSAPLRRPDGDPAAGPAIAWRRRSCRRWQPRATPAVRRACISTAVRACRAPCPLRRIPTLPWPDGWPNLAVLPAARPWACANTRATGSLVTPRTAARAGAPMPPGVSAAGARWLRGQVCSAAGVAVKAAPCTAPAGLPGLPGHQRPTPACLRAPGRQSGCADGPGPEGRPGCLRFLVPPPPHRRVRRAEAAADGAPAGRNSCAMATQHSRRHEAHRRAHRRRFPCPETAARTSRSCREFCGNSLAGRSGHVKARFFRRQGQGASVRWAERGSPSRRPCASGSGLMRAAPRAAWARSRRRAARFVS